MTRKTGELFGQKLEEALEDVLSEDDSKDEMIEGIRENVDFGSIAVELFNEDTEVKEAVKSKVKSLLLKEIEAIENLEDLYDDTDVMHSDIRDSVKVGEVVKEVITSDAQLLEKLRSVIKELVEQQLDNIDENDMPEWEDFLKLIGLSDRIKEVVGQDDVKRILTDKLKEELESHIENNITGDDLPENLGELLEISSQVDYLLRDRDFRDMLNEKIKQELQTVIAGLITEDDSDLNLEDKLKNHHETARLIDYQVSELLQDRLFVANLRESIKTKLLESSKLGSGLLDKIFEAMAKNMVDKLFSKM